MRKKQLVTVSLLILFGVLLFNDQLFAASSDMPYESALLKLKTSLAGPVGTSVGVIALFITAAMFVFGSDLSGMAKALVGVCFSIGVMLGGNTIMDKWFGASSGIEIILSEEILSDKILTTIENEQDI